MINVCNAAQNYSKLEQQYLNSTYQIYKNQIVGDLLLGNSSILNTLIKEITSRRKIGVKVLYGKQFIVSGEFNQYSYVKKYVLALGEGNTASLYLYIPSNFKPIYWLAELLPVLIIEGLVLMLGFYYLWWKFKKRLLQPLEKLAANLNPIYLESHTMEPYALSELKTLNQTLKKMNKAVTEKAIFEAQANAAKQVGHDIRSPLACLNLLVANISELPEKQRVLMQTSVKRISDIANELYSRAQQTMNPGKEDISVIESIMLSTLIDSLVSEKRIQYRELGNIHLKLDLSDAYGVFTRANSSQLKRVLSNLINNCIEAFDKNAHSINIKVEKNSSWISIHIQDDGKGIPKKLLKKIGERGFTLGKNALNNSGTGLGVYHAINIIESYEGTFSIDSIERKGTHVKIKLPSYNSPAWFVRAINAYNLRTMVIVDDDQSIHDLWTDRFASLDNSDINLVHFYSAEALISYTERLADKQLHDHLFLFDCQFSNQSQNGLDIIEITKLRKYSILVTSYYDDYEVRKKAKNLGVQIIPKTMAAFVPIVSLKNVTLT